MFTHRGRVRICQPRLSLHINQARVIFALAINPAYLKLRTGYNRKLSKLIKHDCKNTHPTNRTQPGFRS